MLQYKALLGQKPSLYPKDFKTTEYIANRHREMAFFCSREEIPSRKGKRYISGKTRFGKRSKIIIKKNF